MKKPNRLCPGDKVAIVSLSSGILGEPFVKHELDLGVKRLEEFGLVPVFMDNALKGIDYLKNHPEARANDLKQAFADKTIKAVICAIGGEDSFLTLPHLLSDKSFIENVKNNPKIFMGYSDSTTSHLMFHKLGLNTFYGQALLTDLAEFEPDMLPYSKKAFEYLFNPTENYVIKPSPVWYEDRKDFSPNAVGTMRISHPDTKGYELLQGTGIVEGKLLGGCIEVIGDYVGMEKKYHDELKEVCENYNVFPSLDDWKGKIMFLETSEQKISPDDYKLIIRKFKQLGVFDQISGLLIGKPIDEVFYNEYNKVLKDELGEYSFPILTNINIGHAYPHTLLPIGATAKIDCDNKTLTIVDCVLD